ncbi:MULTISPECIES: hypothetical protein [unclassified Rhizobium]|uniref:hypothetical protein n=1 Tax=unclassified Rhizobium TaxID=2613769 RepID=UPI001ADC1633|nr:MULTISPECIES: hypothetical protein [unclassified Rhizobium]MBO9125491.1 hypothetical protein [Rhizobium sp. 16-488-2b]MBO9176076.1 hypothetical protein [Rhizobium sp. 16-488-2a]
MNLDLAKSLLPEAKHVASLVSEEWAESYDVENMRAEIVVRDTVTGEVVPIAIINRNCGFDDRQLLFKAPLFLRALLTLLGASFAEIKRLQSQQDPQGSERSPTNGQKRDKNYAAECAMRCGDQLFRRFLAEKKGVSDISDDDRVAVAIRRILRVDKRSELNTDAGARNRWLDLRAEFDVWKGHPNG